jgi:hypothetical protein
MIVFRTLLKCFSAWEQTVIDALQHRLAQIINRQQQ